MKIIVIALICFLLGFGAYWGYNKYQSLMEENRKLKEAEKEIPSTVDSNTVFPTEIPTPTINLSKGAIEGVLGYPSEAIPSLEIFAFDSSDLKKYFMVKTFQNQTKFVMEDVDLGTYYVVAYPVDLNSNYAGAYSKMVTCGLSVECTDHSLIPVTVSAGITTTGVEVRDWYAPEGTFPKKP
ncbi:MAG: hypothetical protein V1803_02515 [Candidatus Roizmanbacteria bacterium]